MARIPVQKAEVGMVLTEPVHDRRGRLLMQAGKTLEEKHLDSLPMWGVLVIDIEGDEPDSQTESYVELAPWAIDRATEEMAGVFRHANTDHPVLAALKALRVRRRAEEMQREKHHDH